MEGQKSNVQLAQGYAQGNALADKHTTWVQQCAYALVHIDFSR